MTTQEQTDRIDAILATALALVQEQIDLGRVDGRVVSMDNAYNEELLRRVEVLDVAIKTAKAVGDTT